MNSFSMRSVESRNIVTFDETLHAYWNRNDSRHHGENHWNLNRPKSKNVILKTNLNSEGTSPWLYSSCPKGVRNPIEITKLRGFLLAMIYYFYLTPTHFCPFVFSILRFSKSYGVQGLQPSTNGLTVRTLACICHKK